MEIIISNILAFIAILISIVSVIVHIVLFKISDSRSEESNKLAMDANITSRNANEISNKANDISHRALDVARFSQKKEYQPKFTGVKDEIIISDYFDGNIVLRNESHGKGEIYLINDEATEMLILGDDGRELTYPITLRYNQTLRITARIPKHIADLYEEDYGREALEQKKGEDIRRHRDLRKKLILNHVEDTFIKILFMDQIGTRYESFLKYDENIKSFQPTIIREASEQDSDYFHLKEIPKGFKKDSVQKSV